MIIIAATSVIAVLALPTYGWPESLSKISLTAIHKYNVFVLTSNA